MFEKLNTIKVNVCRIKRKIDELDQSKSSFKVEVRKLYNSTHHLLKKRRVLDQKVQSMVTFTTLHSSEDKMTYKTKHKFLDGEVNVRAILASFFIGTGGCDIAKGLTVVGLGAALSFERNFSNHSLKLPFSTRKVCGGMIHDPFVEEVPLTYKENSCATLYDSMLNDIKQQISSKQYSNLPHTLPKIKICHIRHGMVQERLREGLQFPLRSCIRYWIS